METLKNKQNILPDILNKEYTFTLPDSNLKIATVGDMHLHHSTPASRIDDYSSTCVEKLRIMRRYLNSAGIKYLFCEGDMFHIPKERSDFEYRIIEEFYKFKSDGIQVFEIVGNHTIINDRIDSLDKTSLGILYLTEAIKPLTDIVFELPKKYVRVRGCHFPNDIEPVTDYTDYNICVCHKFYENSLDKDSLMKKHLTNYGYNMYICGHDHVPYPTIVETTTDGLVHIVRPGSFMRGTAHKYNTDRMVYMDVIKFSEEIFARGNQVEVERVTLPVKDPKEIFSAVVIDKDSKVSLRDTTQELSELVDRIYSQELSNTSVYDVLDNSVIDPQIKNRIIQYLEQYGIYRKNNIKEEK